MIDELSLYSMAKWWNKGARIREAVGQLLVTTKEMAETKISLFIIHCCREKMIHCSMLWQKA